MASYFQGFFDPKVCLGVWAVTDSRAVWRPARPTPPGPLSHRPMPCSSCPTPAGGRVEGYRTASRVFDFQGLGLTYGVTGRGW